MASFHADLNFWPMLGELVCICLLDALNTWAPSPWSNSKPMNLYQQCLRKIEESINNGLTRLNRAWPLKQAFSRPETASVLLQANRRNTVAQRVEFPGGEFVDLPRTRPPLCPR
jgi:hypothetical protein